MVGIGNVVMSGLVFVYFFGVVVVIIDIWYVVDDFFIVKLQDNVKCIVCRWVVWVEVEEYKVFVVSFVFYFLVFWFKGQCFYFQILFGFGQFKWIEFGCVCWIIFMQWMVFSGLWYYDVCQVWVVFDINIKYFSGFMFVLVGVREKFSEGWYVQVVFR